MNIISLKFNFYYVIVSGKPILKNPTFYLKYHINEIQTKAQFFFPPFLDK